MSGLQKQGLVISIIAHVAAGWLLFFGPDWESQPEPIDRLPPMRMVSAQIADQAIAGGQNRGSTEADELKPEPAPQPEPEPKPQPKPEPKEPKPKPKPQPKPTEKKKESPAEPITPSLEPVEKAEPKEETSPSKPIEVSTDLVEREVSSSEPKVNLNPTTRLSQSSNASRVDSVVERLEEGLSSSTDITTRGSGSSAFEDYALVVKRTYQRAWIPPSQVAGGDAKVQIRVTLARSGRVISADVVSQSSSSELNRSARRVCERVATVNEPFPSESQDDQRTFLINFNLETKQL